MGNLKKQVTLNEKMMKNQNKSLIMSPPKTMEQTPKKGLGDKSLGGEELQKEMSGDEVSMDTTSMVIRGSIKPDEKPYEAVYKHSTSMRDNEIENRSS